MDARSREQSMRLYYGFKYCEDTSVTCQMTRRAWGSMVNQLDNLANRSTRNVYYQGTGSQDEGTSLRGVFLSDMDMMLVCTKFYVYPIGYTGDYNWEKCCVQLKKSEHTRPGYCLVEVVGETYIDLDSYVKHEQQSAHEFVVRMNMFKSDKTLTNLNQTKMTGPAVAYVSSVKRYQIPFQLSHDYVVAIASKHWPPECRNWSQLITWPSVTLQEAIKREGFHIVRVGHPLSPERDQEWRLSFSFAEKMLIESFNPTQLTCLVVMKLLLNHYIKPVVPDSINSYHIKTLILWSVEQDIDQKWEPQYFIHCLTKLLTKLMKCISLGKLQHYFILDTNLFEYKVTKNNKELLFQEVEALKLSIVDKCISLLGIIGVLEKSPLRYAANLLQSISLKINTFRPIILTKIIVSIEFLNSIIFSMKQVVRDLMTGFYESQRQLCISFVKLMLSVLPCFIPNSHKDILSRLSDKWLSYFKTWCGSILTALFKSNKHVIRMDGNNTLQHMYDAVMWKSIGDIGSHLLTESYENASTTGCIRMALIYICEGDNYNAIPLLNKTLNIIDQLDNYCMHRPDELPDIEYNFTEYMHMYNDQQAIECALTTELLNDKVLIATLLIWLEMSVLPSLLQLELTHTFYKVDIAKILDHPDLHINPFQYWNPIPLTHFLLFICHYELLKSVTFLDPACLQEDIKQLKSLIHDRQRLTQDEVPSLLNLLAWCYLKIGDKNLMVNYSLRTVKQSSACDKTVFSHLCIQHVLGAVIKTNVKCIIS